MGHAGLPCLPEADLSHSSKYARRRDKSELDKKFAANGQKLGKYYPTQYLLEGTPVLVIISNPKTANCQNIAAVTATTIFIKPQENEPSETLNKQSMPIMATQSFDSFAFLKCETFFALHYFA